MSNSIIYPLTLDIRRDIHQVLVMKESDVDSRIINITITDNGKPYNVTDKDIKYKWHKPDHKFVFNDCKDMVSSDTISILCTEQMLAVAGIAKCEVIIYDTDDKTVLSTMIFNVSIQNSVISNKDIESSDEFGTLNDLIFESKQLGEGLKDLEKDISENESNREAAENERVENENNRNLAEQERVNAENERKKNELNRQSAESERVKSENERVENEKQRIENANIKEIDIILYASKWVGTNAPYTQTVDVGDLSIYNGCNVVLSESASFNEVNAVIEADFSSITYSPDTGMVFTIQGVKPSVDIHLRLYVGTSMNVVKIPEGVESGLPDGFDPEMLQAQIESNTEKIEALENNETKYALKEYYDRISVNIGRKAGSEKGSNSFAFGFNVEASGSSSHAEGMATTASDTCSHAEGSGTTASGGYSHAEGYNTTASGDYSHAEGRNTKAIGERSHAEGSSSEAQNLCAHAEGSSTASGVNSHSEGSITTANGDNSHAEGARTTSNGANSHAEGVSTKAESNASHAEGRNTVASGDYSHAEGYGTTTSSGYSHAEGYNTTASGSTSHSEGSGSKASGDYSHAENYETESSGSHSHAEGYKTVASGNTSHTEGSECIASYTCCHAEGYGTTARGHAAHAEGYKTVASGAQAAAMGYYTNATNARSLAIGHYNAAMTNVADDAVGSSSSHAFCIGNGILSARANAFSVMFNGVVKAASTITASTAADYAEFFEWADGNPENEDRVGKFVTLDGDKIRISSDKDDYILGIISGNPFVLGNGDCDTWNGMYLRDEFGRIIYEPAPKMTFNEETGEYVEVKDENGDPVYDGVRTKLNPNYDSTQKYISRFDRKEWSPVGMVGVLPVIQDGTCKVNGYCHCNKDGIATACEKDTTNAYRVIKKVSDRVVKIIVK